MKELLEARLLAMLVHPMDTRYMDHLYHIIESTPLSSLRRVERLDVHSIRNYQIYRQSEYVRMMHK